MQYETRINGLQVLIELDYSGLSVFVDGVTVAAGVATVDQAISEAEKYANYLAIK